LEYLIFGRKTPPIGAMQLRNFRLVGQVANLFHKVANLSSRRRPTGLRLVIAMLALVATGSGCAEHVYRASKLPPELMAPAELNLDTINLSGLAEQSVSAEVIQPGDVLEVAMVTDYTKLTTTTTPVRVADDGTILVPLVGRVCVGGLEVERAEQAVNAESITRGIFRTPCITLTMKLCRTQTVTVVGAVNKPGPHELPRGSTSLMAALLAAEGLSKEAGTEVVIRHTDSRQIAQAGGQPGLPPGTGNSNSPAVQAAYARALPTATEPAVVTVDLTAAAAGAAPVPNLRDGDVVNVAKRKLPPIYVMGLVTRPGEFPYPPSQEIRVTDALALAGGVSNAFAEDVLIIRHLPNAPEPVRIAVSIQGAKNGRDNIALAPGDTISVERTAATALLDVIQKIGNFGIGASMPIF
jgi:polysaccharide export outer membrane protein